MQITVTDVTKFTSNEIYCVAGFGDDGNCYRPTSSYFSVEDCQQLNILPGAVLDGDFEYLNSDEPHCEDCSRENVRFIKNSTATEFKDVLEDNLAESVESGFDCDLSEYRKCISADSPPNCSIITVKVNPRRCWVNPDRNNVERLRFTFYEKENDHYSYLPVADLKIREYFTANPTHERIEEICQFVRSQSELYLRIGIGRKHKVNDRNGYWLQVNGIYTFPDWIPGTRGLQD